MTAATAPVDDSAATVEQLCDPLWVVRDSARFIEKHAAHVRVDQEAVAVVASHWDRSGLLQARPPFDRQLHYVRGPASAAVRGSQR